MSTAAFSLSPDISTDALFRTWGSTVAGQFSAMGLVQTADTGQINWATVLHPTSSNTKKGYEIWRFADTLQATRPIFIRIDYGSGSNASGLNPSIWITVGFATDGAGTISGAQQSDIRQVCSSGISTVSTGVGALNCIASGGTNRFGLALHLNAATVAFTAWFTVERSKDASGVDDATGFMVAGGQSNSHFLQYIPASGGVPSIEIPIPAVLSNNTSSAFGTTIGLGRPVPLAGSPQNPGNTILVHVASDFTRDSTHAITVDGVSRTYYIVGPNLTNVSGTGGNVGTNSRLALRYD